MNHKLDRKIDELLASKTVSVSDNFSDKIFQSLGLPKEDEAQYKSIDSRIDAMLHKSVDFDTPDFCERVLQACLNSKRKFGKKILVFAASITFAAAASIAFMFASGVNSPQPPSISDYEKMCSIMDEINNITYLVLEEERFDLLRF